MTRVSAFQAISASERWGKQRLAPLTLVVLGFLSAHCALAQEAALPQNGSVTHGNVSIATPAPGQMVLNQTSDRAVLNWGSFSIGRGNTVDIHQPGTNSAILNRVTGNTTSQIHGQLNANGQVFVVNPNGVFIGKDGQVSAGGGVVASTLNTSDDNFMAGRLRFEGNGASAEVVNEGRVLIGRGGFAALLGGRVSNSGLVMVPMGQIGFGAGERATLDVSGDGFLEIEVPSEMQDEMRALIENSGTASAEGGLIEMKAATARHAARHAINLSGVAEASSVSARNGAIVLGGGAGGRVTVSGRVSTRAKKPRRPAIVVENSRRPKSRRGGGDITILGRQIELSGAQVDASGAGQAGRIHIGGTFQGGDSLPSALYLDVDSASSIRADGVQVGDGGRVILWSDVHTDFAGDISARGGAGGGDGGFVEVSGKQTLAFSGLVDTRAPLGAMGTLLLDPYNVFIEDVTFNTGGSFVGNDFVPTADDSILSVAQLEINLATNNITVTTGTGGTQNGDITVNSQIDWTSGSTLTFDAFGDVILNAGVQAPAGGFTIDAGGSITTGPAGTVNVNAFELAQGDWNQVAAVLPQFVANDFTLDVSLDTSFVRATAGDGTTTTPYVLTDIYGVQGIGTQPLLDDNFVLGSNIDASVTDTWTGGFAAIQGIGFTGFSGTLDGQGNTISDLTVFDSSGGFFGLTQDASISNLNIAGLDMFGCCQLGGLVNRAIDTQIDNVDIAGEILGDQASDLGGIVGSLEGATSTVSNSSFVGAISAPAFVEGNMNIGGLIGSNTLGTLSDSSFSGTLSDSDNLGAAFHRLGGAVGDNRGTITGVTTAGTITPDATGGPMFVGGIAGENQSFEGITQSSSSVVLDIDNSADDAITAGGLVGRNIGSITESQSTGNVDVVAQGGPLNIGGLIGLNENTATRPVDDVSASGVVNVTNASTGTVPISQPAVVGGLIGRNLGPINDVHASGNVIVDAGVQIGYVGGLAGINSTTAGTITVGTATGDVTATTTIEATIGGFVGLNEATISDAVASGAVSLTMPVFGGPSGDEVLYLTGAGGFAGFNSGAITRTAARGDVTNVATTVESGTGGHTGLNDDGTILDSYALGAVTSASSADQALGGLVGATQGGMITNTHSSGAVTAGGSGTIYAGGLIGVNEPTNTPVTASYWDTVTSGQADTFGTNLGLGLTTAQFEDTQGFLTLAGDDGWNFNTVWAPGASERYPTLYSIDRVVFARPDAVTLTYGDTTDASTTGTVTGGPALHIFVESGETLDTAPIFETLTFPDNTVGLRDFTVDTTPLTSSEDQTYDVVALPGSATINPAPLELTVTDTSKVYGSALSFDGTEFSVTGGELFFADSVETITIASAGAIATAEVAGSPYAITGDAPVTGTRVANYDISFVDGALTVNPAPLELTVTDTSKVYGSALSFDGTEFSVTGGELFFADSVETITIASAGAIATAEVAGSPYAITGDAPVTGTRVANYDISFVDGALTVNPAPLELTVTDTSKVYGSALSFDGTEFSVTGGELFFADSVETITIASAGAIATAEVAGSPYAITGDAPVTGTRVANYDISFVDGALTVNPAPLELTVTDTSKVYGSALSFDGTEFSVTGGELFFADSVETITIASAGAIATAEVAGSPYAITGDAPVTGTRVANYDISFVDGALTVNPAPLELTVTDTSKVYGSALSFDGTEFSVTGGELFFADSVETITIASAGAIATAEVAGSPYAITGDAPVTGTRVANYDISFVDGALTVNPAPLELTVTDTSKVYGSALSFDGTEFSVTGGELFFADSVETITIASAGAIATAEVAGSPYAITGDAPVTGTRVANYDISFVDGALTVNPAPLELTVTDTSKVYGSALSFDGTEFSVTGGELFFADSVETITIASAGAIATAEVAGSPYAITGDAPVTGTRVANYDISFVDGALTVNPAPLELTVTDTSKVYGSALSFDGTEFSVTGGELFFADSVETITIASAGAIATAEVAGSPYAITGDAPVTGTRVANYDISFVDGALTVNPAPLELTVTDTSKVYGSALSFDGTEFSVTGGELFFADSVETITIASAGAIATAEVAGSPYAITGDAPVTGTRVANYDISFVDGALTVNPAPLELTVTDTSKVYGSALSFDGTEFSVTGGELFFADSVETITIASAGAIATAEVAGSPYAITGDAPVTGTRVANYDISFVDGALTVNPAPLELTVTDTSKVYGSALSFDGTEFSVTGGELFFADSVETITIASAGAIATAEVAGSPYAITGDAPVTGTRVANYDISFVDGALTVNPAPLELTVTDTSKVYGSALSFDGTEFSVTGGELFFADSVETITIASAGAIATAEVAGSPYAITGDAPVTGTRVANYDISFVDGALTVNPAPLELTVTDTSKVYGSALSFDGTEFSVTGGELFFADSVETITIASAGAIATAEVAGSPYAITGDAPVTGTRVANYDISFVDGALTVSTAPLMVTANDQVKDEGGTIIFDGTEFTSQGLLFSDTIDSVNLSSLGAPAAAPAGQYAIEVFAATGSGLENYHIIRESGTLDVQEVAGPGDNVNIFPTQPVPSFTLPNPLDVVILDIGIAIGGLEGAVGSVAQRGSVSNRPVITQARETLTSVQEIATTLETSTAGCSENSGNVDRYLACLSDAIDDFAAELDEISTDLPPGMENVANIVRDASRNVTQARNLARARLASATTDAQRRQIRREAVGQAQAALSTASAEIRKAINFVRADDPELAAVQRSTINTVAAAVENAGIGLSKVTEL